MLQELKEELSAVRLRHVAVWLCLLGAVGSLLAAVILCAQEQCYHVIDKHIQDFGKQS